MSVDLSAAGGRITLTVADNGVGMPTYSRRRSGTANMQVRAERRDGRFDLSPAPGGGTVVSWEARS